MKGFAYALGVMVLALLGIVLEILTWIPEFFVEWSDKTKDKMMATCTKWKLEMYKDFNMQPPDKEEYRNGRM